jgi:hypothetical protein
LGHELAIGDSTLSWGSIMRYWRLGRAATTVLALGRAAAVLLGIQIALAPAVDAADQQRGANQVQTVPARTIKERLSGKASDEQRVDNCKVPPELRGPKPRPDDCRHRPRAASAR